MWGGKSGVLDCWSTKAAISSKRVKTKDREKLLRRAYRNSATLFRTVPSPTPYGLLFPNFGGSQTLIAISSGTGEAIRTSYLAVHSEGPSDQKPIKNFAEKGA